jgi:8-oxo-dGTP diphosphatase
LIESKNSSAGEVTHVVAAIVWQPGKEHRFLISKRQKGKHLEDYWELPGGKVESGESCRQALDRELCEEIDIVPFKASRFKQVSHQYKDRNILLDVWEVTSFKGNVTAREGQELRWITVDDLDRYQFPEADIPVLRAIANISRVKTEHPA